MAESPGRGRRPTYNPLGEECRREGRRPTQLRSRRSFPIVPIIVLLCVASVIVGLYPRYHQKFMEGRRLSAQIAALERNVVRITRENTHKRRQIARLNTREGIEAEARKSLGLVKPGEEAFLIVQDPADSDPSSSPAPPVDLPTATPASPAPASWLDHVRAWWQALTQW